MKFPSFINTVYILIVVSYVLLILTFIALGVIQNNAGQTVYSDSDFFKLNSKFTLLGIEFDHRPYFALFAIIFFMNSLLYWINIAVINPLFSRIIFAYNGSGKIPSNTRLFLSTLLLFYDLWNAFRSLLSILGVTSNIVFFIASTLGYLVGDIAIKNLYLIYPDYFRYEYGFLSVDEHLGDSAHINPTNDRNVVQIIDEDDDLFNDRFEEQQQQRNRMLLNQLGINNNPASVRYKRVANKNNF